MKTRAAVVPSRNTGGNARAASTIDVDLGNLRFRGVRLPPPGAEDLDGFEGGAESRPGGEVIGRHAEVRLPRKALRWLVSDLTDAEEAAILERATTGTLTAKGFTEVLGEERARRALRGFEPESGDAIRIEGIGPQGLGADLPSAPTLGAGHLPPDLYPDEVVTIRVVRLPRSLLRMLVPDLTDAEARTLAERGQAGRLDAAGLREVLGADRAGRLLRTLPGQARDGTFEIAD